MLPVPIEKKSCRTCQGDGFIWRGIIRRHQTLTLREGQPTVQVSVSRIRDVCPECHGTGTTLPREVQRTPWALALRP
jgi:DnaJ-class molecular chaperone